MALVLFPGCSNVSNTSRPVSTTNDELEIVFLDVGQGDAALLSCGGEYALIDGGNAADSSLIYSALKSRGIDHLRYIINSHSDEDHVGGLAGALNYAKVDICLAPSDTRDTKVFNNFKKYLSEQGISITIPKLGDTFPLGSATLEVVAPTRDWGDVNDNSLVILLRHGDIKVLFTGDISSDVEKDLVNNSDIHDIDLLKVAHHGSDTSSCYEFLYYTNPRFAVISSDGGARYGHPTANVLSRFRDQGAVLYRTDLQGDIRAVSDGKDLTITTQRQTTTDVYSR